jgi:hypothetical protein
MEGRPCQSVLVFVQEDLMKGILLWLVGIPIPVIILLYLFDFL